MTIDFELFSSTNFYDSYSSTFVKLTVTIRRIIMLNLKTKIGIALLAMLLASGIAYAALTKSVISPTTGNLVYLVEDYRTTTTIFWKVDLTQPNLDPGDELICDRYPALCKDDTIPATNFALIRN